MATVTNTSSTRRHWNDLVDQDTGRTLDLEPGESAEVDLPDGFSDPFLDGQDETPIAEAPSYTPPSFDPPLTPEAEEAEPEGV